MLRPIGTEFYQDEGKGEARVRVKYEVIAHVVNEAGVLAEVLRTVERQPVGVPQHPSERKAGNHQARETKASPVFVTSVDEVQGIVEAVVSVFGIIDLGNDIIHPGAYVKTITERAGKIRVLDQHNTDSILRAVGKPIELREVGREGLPAEILSRFPEATGGLYTKTQYLLDTPEGKGAFQRIASGAVNEYSIGYDALDVDYSKVKTPDGRDITVRNIRTIKLYEYSPVLWGMNQATATVSAKAEEGAASEEAKAQSLGAMLQGCVIRELNWYADSFLSSEQITLAERQQISEATFTALAAFTAALPEEVATRIYRSPYDEWSADGASEGKAGRVLSARNMTRIREALAALTDVLAAAGLAGDDDEEGEEEGKQSSASADSDDKAANTEESKAQSEGERSSPDAGPGRPPTLSEIQRELIELELIEVR